MAKFVNNIKMLSKENKMLMVVLFVIALFAISGILGFTYAYFVSDALGDPQLIGIDTATLSLRYTDCSDNPDDCNNIVAKMSPGDSITKTFQVENTGTDSTTYKLYFLELLNTFVDNELVYKIERTDINRTIIGTSAIPYYETLRVNQKIYDDITISKGATHKYKITITFLNKAEGNNPVNLDAEFKIKLGIQQTGITKTNAVLVTDIFVSGNVDADLSNSKINDYTGTTINTTNVLSNSNGNSSITYQVTVYNSTRKDYTYLGTNDVSSDNNNIKYKISGINYGDKLASMSGSIFDITFYYDGNTVPSAYELNSEIEFIFEQAYIVTYSNISGDYPTIVYANVPLEIDLSSTGYDTFEVYQGTTKLTELLNYNVDGKKLNIFNVSGNIEIRGVTNICAKNNITNLGDCLIAADQNTTDINAAKTNIKNTRTLTSYPQEPKIIYEEKIEYDEWLGAAYIDSSTDNPTLMFSTEPPIYSSSSRTWKLKSGTTFIGNFTDYVSNETNKYYTCLNTSGACSTAYVYYSIQIVKGENSVYRCFVRNADVYTEQISGSSISNPGLYYAEDDYGDSYYYRGAVRNNYVNFAGFLWRIVRINGDNSIRLVKETNISVSTNPNAKTVIDPATVGYTYKLDRTFKTIPEEGSVTISLNSSSDYYYGTEYTYDYDKSVWTISGYKTNGTFYDKANQILNGDSTSGNIPYKYTCLSTSENGTCHYIYEIVHQ